MAITSGFFNSLNGDRKYNSLQVSQLFDGVITDGVFMTIGNGFAVKADGNPNSVSVDTGRAWFNRHWVLNDNVTHVIFEQSDLLLDRYDAVVIEIDDSVNIRNGTIKAIKGVPSTKPAYPVLTKTENVHQYPLAYILRKHNDDSITQAQITAMVGKTECPWVTGVVSTMSIDYIVAQWADQWDEWFGVHSSELEDQTDRAVELAQSAIDGTTAGQLWNKINTLEDSLLDRAYPIGSYYLSDDPTSPAEILGGSWSKLEGYVLRAGADTDTGGSDTVTLSTANMPAHTHTGPSHTHTMAHTHTGPSHTHGVGTLATNSTGAHQHSSSTAPVNNNGSGTQITTIAKGSGTSLWYTAKNSDNLNNGGTHSHTISGATAAAGTGNTGAASNSTTSASGTGNTGSAGSGTAFSNLPKYRNIHVWRRVA